MSRARIRIAAASAVVALLLCLPSAARANEQPSERSWHAGVNLRTELGTHPVRLGGGVKLSRLELTAVVDPMFWTDGQQDIDLLVGFRISDPGWAALAGWRTSTLGLPGGRHWQQKLLLGVLAPLPDLGRYVRASWGVELSSVVVKHGGGLPSEWISFESGRDFIDLINFGMFVRFEYEARM